MFAAFILALVVGISAAIAWAFLIVWPFPELAQPQGQRGWICPVCGAGVSPSVSQHCTQPAPNVTITPNTGPIKAGKWCSLCRSTYYGEAHFCGRASGGTGTFTSAPSTTATSNAGWPLVVCSNGCDAVEPGSCDCP